MPMWLALRRPSLACRLLPFLPAALRPSQPAPGGAAPLATRAGMWNRPPQSVAALHGCDFNHWLVVMEPPPGDPACPDTPRDEIILCYVSTLARVLRSENEARDKMYSVSTRYYFAFGASISEETSIEVNALPKVLYTVPDSYIDVKKKTYGGEPFVNGKAVVYDPKYHEKWISDNSLIKEKCRYSFEALKNYEKFRDAQRSLSPKGHDQISYQRMPPPPPHDINAPLYHPHSVNPQWSPSGNELAGPADQWLDYFGNTYQVGEGHQCEHAGYQSRYQEAGAPRHEDDVPPCGYPPGGSLPPPWAHQYGYRSGD